MEIPCSPLIGPGMEEDRGEEDQVPRPGSAQVWATQEDPGAPSSSACSNQEDQTLVGSNQTNSESQDDVKEARQDEVREREM